MTSASTERGARERAERAAVAVHHNHVYKEGTSKGDAFSA